MVFRTVADSMAEKAWEKSMMVEVCVGGSSSCCNGPRSKENKTRNRAQAISDLPVPHDLLPSARPQFLKVSASRWKTSIQSMSIGIS